jgi:hypothetical protein
MAARAAIASRAKAARIMIMAILPIWAACLLNTRQVHFFQSLNKGNIMSGNTFAIFDVVHTSQPERNDATFSRAMKGTPISASFILSTFLDVRLPWSIRRQLGIQRLT